MRNSFASPRLDGLPYLERFQEKILTKPHSTKATVAEQANPPRWGTTSYKHDQDQNKESMKRQVTPLCQVTLRTEIQFPHLHAERP